MLIPLTRFLILLCTVFHATSLFSEPITGHTIPSSSLAATSGLVSSVANDSVCVITGELVDSQTDLVVPGPVSLSVTRNYSSHDQSASSAFPLDI